jgi:hypothetical protein
MKTNANSMLLFSGDYRQCKLTDIPCLAKNKRESYLETYSISIPSKHCRPVSTEIIELHRKHADVMQHMKLNTAFCNILRFVYKSLKNALSSNPAGLYSVCVGDLSSHK